MAVDRDDIFQPWLDRWGLTRDGDPFTTTFGSHLLPVTRDGVAAMLKIAGGEEEERGAAAMEWWGGEGAARVLARDGAALLLERVVGERSLAAMARGGKDDEATAILCRTALSLHAPRAGAPPASLVPLPLWFRALAPAAGRFGGILRQSADAAGKLLASAAEPVVLHGDIHHDNVLDGGSRGWLAIDPKGLIGERGFDYANMLCNPGIEVAGAPGRLAARAAIVAREGRLEPQRILMWTLAYAGLSAAWTLGDGDDASQALAIAELAAAHLRA
jgi:streptomycin 6-kinase